MATSYRRRLEALELVRAVTCEQLCAKCSLARLMYERDGKPWSGCNGRPMGATQVIKSATHAELLALAGFDHEPTDAELEAIINAPTAEHSEGDV